MVSTGEMLYFEPMTESSGAGGSSFPYFGFGSATAFETAVGGKVRKYREARGMSQRHVVEVLNADHNLGWHQTTLAKTESGERPLRLSEAIVLADVFGVPVESLSPLAAPGQPEGTEILLRARASEMAHAAKLLEHRRLTLLRMADDLHAGKDWDLLAYGPRENFDA